ncbi:NAD(P)-dependent oxidoreductase [Neolewinella antarctica]|uniref:D-3-phosphoglycerate dehydrogenase n=1 Tax=Neolewinella antarctica TaxID=442734 RepID=A0ABX0XCB5_9BACT|nr:NAD(P)-dependent oxidoreductase [Neolewinella antarctica]NJC26478.1 D-3-phosphoglycerate dehydrogenase [Neolewinella antarctica]
MRIAFLDKAAHPYLKNALTLEGHTVDELDHLTRPDVLQALQLYDGLMIRSRLDIDRELIDACPAHFRFVARWGVGTDHIDLKYAEERSIKVFNSPEGSKHTVAEHTLGMMLMLLNHLGRADRQVRGGEWVRRGNIGTELGHLTVGLIGYGNMGQETAKRLSGFGCRVLAHDKFRKNYGDEYAEEITLNQLQKEADVVSLHIFLEGNHHYANAAWFNAFAKPIYLINTARGQLVNTEDLVAAMEADRVLSAALDVHEYEEQSFVHLAPNELPEPFQYLRRSERTVLTPHIAGWSAEAEEGHAHALFAKIEAAFRGR